ncbi:hypothetical protein FACS189427_07860 [Planctomycetales bacterium]|nr:hypothetical protein FACS189427_07860 [Planctomycetales bacterium]
MAKDKINVFFPHYGGDEKYIEKVKNLISRKYNVRDSSIKESEPNKAHDKEYIKSIIRDQIDWAGTVIVLIGDKTHTRPWVDYEIEYAEKKEKRIVGVFLQGATEADLPQALKDGGNACVAWNADKICRAIEGENIWEASDGTPRPSVGSRGEC